MMDLTQNIPEEKEVAIAVTLIPDLEKDTQFSQGLQIDADQEEAWVMADFKSGSRFRYISYKMMIEISDMMDNNSLHFSNIPGRVVYLP
jgi:hypothetical protein